MRLIVDLRLLLLLLGAGLVGLLSELLLEKYFNRLSDPRPGLRASVSGTSLRKLTSFAIKLIVVAAAVCFGLLLSEDLRLKAVPLLDGLLNGAEVHHLWGTIITSVFSGLAVGAVMAISMLVLLSHEGASDASGIPLWRRLAAGVLYGGIIEEIVFRLFLLTLLVWAARFVFGISRIPVPPEVFWAANLGAALIFGLAHLPLLLKIFAPARKRVAMTMTLNCLGGLVYGYLFWQLGFEAAVMAHMSTHVALQLGTSLSSRNAVLADHPRR